MSELFTRDQAADYWNTRHRSETELRAGGNRGLDEPTNEILYAIRLGRLLEIIGDGSDSTHPLQLLDAGCGRGWFARAMARCGHQVDAIDASAAAIESCRAQGGGPRFAQSTLAGWRSPHLYDAVYSIDVLFHVTDEPEWVASVANLASLVRLGGRLVLTDWHVEEEIVFSDYQVARPTRRYHQITGAAGLRSDGWLPDGFRESSVGFHVFTRVA